MLVLVAGLALFLGSHVFTMNRDGRAATIARVGEGPYKIVYSLVALAGLVLVGQGYGEYRRSGWIDVWYPPVWTKHLALLLVWAAFVCVTAAYVPGRIKTALKHPMLAGVKIWALSHLLSNGDLGSIVLFGSILAWAVVARISIKRRPDEVLAHAGPAAAPAGWRNDVLAVAIGTALWFVFARWLHPLWIGVAVWPGT